MGLQVWLPLNKDLRNVGLQDIVMVNHGATFSTDNNEKCYYFNGVQQWLQFNQKLGNFYNNDFSFCFWINPTDDTRSVIISEFAGTGASNISIELSDNRVLRLYWNGTPNKYFTTAGALTKNAWTHVSILKSGRNVWVYLNGILKETYTNSSDFPSRTSDCYPRIGDDYRGDTGSTASFKGYLRDFRMYDHALTASDVLRIYNNRSIFEIPYSQENEKPEYPLWLKLLHHNAPASQLFTTANYKKNSDNDLYSRCGWMFGNTIFKLDNDKYEMLAKEKLESGSTENIFRWTQTSSPTDSTITGFKKITNSCNSSYLVGLKHNGNYSAFHNGGSWWCACGSYTAYQGGTPGFQNVVKTGYMDLWVRAEIKHLPSKYEELEWVKFAPGQYINTELAIVAGDATITKAKMRYETGESGRDLMGWSTAAANYWGVTSGGTWEKIVFTNSGITALNYLTYTYTAANNGTYQIGALTGTYSVRSKYIYNFKIYVNGDLKRNMIPCMRKSDSKVGMYDLVTKKFYTHTGSGNLVDGPAKHIPKEYEQLEYIQSDGAQFIDTGIKPCMNKIRCICDMSPLDNADNTFFGSRGTYYLFYKVYDNYFWPTSKCETIQGTLAIGEKYHIDWNKGTLIVSGPNGVYQKGVRSNNTQDTYNMYLFNFNPEDSYRTCVAKLYYFKIYIDDILVRNFIPSKRKSDNVMGLYDTVSRQFFTNAGSGSFTGE